MRVILYDKKDGRPVADLNGRAVLEVALVRRTHLRGVIKQWQADYDVEMPDIETPESVL